MTSKENSEILDALQTKSKTLKGRPQCLICGKNISDRRNLVRHLRRIHCVEPLVRKPQLRCSYNSECTYLCATSELLRDHLKSAHDFDVKQINLNFKCREDFDKWKQEEELNTNARYVAYTGTKCRGTKKVYYLKCHRSGIIRCHDNKQKERKRSRPTKGYTQCGTTCPSSIRVAEAANGSIQALYFPRHLGHTLDDESIPYMKLSSKEKEEIVGKLAQGEPVGKIVLDARKKKGSRLSRLNLLQRRDVYNLKKKINYIEKDEDHDGKIIDRWIRSLDAAERSPQNPVVLYCPPVETKTKDYTLILVHNIQKIIYSLVFDGSIVYVKTKKGKPNVDFNLIALTVICDNGDGYPIAFCLSRKTEYMTFYTFFKIVYQNFGMIKAEIFVSDNSSQLYLAWKNVMGECGNKLICTFDMTSYWEQKLTVLKCPVGKQKEISRQLKLLLLEEDKDVFEANLVDVLKAWENDEDWRLFHNFFHKFYVKKRVEWANCYRIHSRRKENINTYLEPINSILDSIYVESYCSLENSLNYLFAFVRDVCLLKLIKWDDQIAHEKKRDTEKNHGESERVKGVKAQGSEWLVTDSNGSVRLVRKTQSDCDKKCGVFCSPCDACVHDYYCVCTDYVLFFNMCRHIHAVIKVAEEGKTSEPKDISRNSGSKSTAVLMAESLASDLADSNLSEKEYLNLIENLSELKQKVSQHNDLTI